MLSSHPTSHVWSVALGVWCYHLMLSSHVITQFFHPMLSPNVIIPCYHLMLSPLLSSQEITASIFIIPENFIHWNTSDNTFIGRNVYTTAQQGAKASLVYLLSGFNPIDIPWGGGAVCRPILLSKGRGGGGGGVKKYRQNRGRGPPSQ
jgi:hypothetical protein